MKPTDVRGKPGDIVTIRGGTTTDVWRRTGAIVIGTDDRAGSVAPGAVGIIVSIANLEGWTYVLWSKPCLAGFIYDGALRVLK